MYLGTSENLLVYLLLSSTETNGESAYIAPYWENCRSTGGRHNTTPTRDKGAEDRAESGKWTRDLITTLIRQGQTTWKDRNDEVEQRRDTQAKPVKGGQ